MIFLRSSAIRGVKYYGRSEYLGILFTSGGYYTYGGVPQWMYEELISSASPGQYFNKYISSQEPLVRKIQKSRRLAPPAEYSHDSSSLRSAHL